MSLPEFPGQVDPDFSAMFGNFGADVVVQADFQPSGDVEIHELRIKCVFVGW